MDRGYRTTVAEKLKGWFFLYVNLPEDLVDPNVHPTKAEVRFDDSCEVEELMERSVQMALSSEASSASFHNQIGKSRIQLEDSDSVEESEQDSQTALFLPSNSHWSVAKEEDSQADLGIEELEKSIQFEKPNPGLLQVLNTYILAETQDGLIIVDLPPEEPELLHIMENSSLQFIYLITPTTNDERLPKVIKHASGFIYYVSVTGITGTKTASSEHVELALSRIRRYTDLPIAVGFGIKTPEQAAKIAQYANAAVVGSALVSRVEDNLDANGKPTSACVTAVLDFVGQISEGIRSISKNAQENAAE